MDSLKSVMALISQFITVGGAMWMAWGVIQFGFGVHSRDGHEMKNAFLMIVGAAIVTAGGVMIGKVGS